MLLVKCRKYCNSAHYCHGSFLRNKRYWSLSIYLVAPFLLEPWASEPRLYNIWTWPQTITKISTKNGENWTRCGVKVDCIYSYIWLGLHFLDPHKIYYSEQNKLNTCCTKLIPFIVWSYFIPVCLSSMCFRNNTTVI